MATGGWAVVQPFEAQDSDNAQTRWEISKELIEELMGWHHSGFSEHPGKRIARDDPEGQDAMAAITLVNLLLREISRT